MDLPVLQPSKVTVMIKPVGALCNLDCHYCYYLPTTALYGHREHRMKLDTLEATFASILPRFADEVTIAWQGGEPTLAGLAFFEKMIEFQEKYRRPGQHVGHCLQTNATLLNDDWCRFFKKHNFLIGVSLDGPRRFHDHYRLTRKQNGSADAVLDGLRLLQRHGVQHNLLTVLNDRNVKSPEEIYGYLYNIGCRYMQFIPAIEWRDAGDGRYELQPFSPTGEAYGRFLCRVFDLWFERHRHEVSVRLFDVVMNRLVMGQSPLCIMDASCHGQLTIEHDGAVFGCDHFVTRRWQLGQIGDPRWSNEINPNMTRHIGLDFQDRNVDDSVMNALADQTAAAQASDGLDVDWFDRIDGRRLGVFAARKQNLPPKCLQCQWKPFCYGGCPKHRPSRGEFAEPSTLCAGYQQFFEHSMPRFQWLAGFLMRGQQPPPPTSVAPPPPGRAMSSPSGEKPKSKKKRKREQQQARRAAQTRR